MLAGHGFAQETASPPSSPEMAAQGLKLDASDAKLLFSVIRIEAKSADGRRSATGTGFVFNYNTPLHRGVQFVVTCRHVVEGFGSATLSFVQRKGQTPSLGQNWQVTVANLREGAFFDPDPRIDVALIPLRPLLPRPYAGTAIPYFQTLGEELIPDHNAAGALGAIRPVVFVGFPDGLWDKTNGLPITRSGLTSSPYVLDYEGVPIFLIDARVDRGSSGSPVVVIEPVTNPLPAAAQPGERLQLLGMLSDDYFQTVNGQAQFRSPPNSSPPASGNIGAVVKFSAILNTMSEYLKVHPIEVKDDDDRSKN
jgi:hypothetical protein